jgi:predicted MFS family arabinose efflux permease
MGNVILVIALWFVKIERQEHHGRASRIIDDVVEGIRYVARHPGIMPTLALAATWAVLARPLQDLMPGFTDTVFGRGADGLATLMAAMGVGGMIGSFWIANRNRIIGTSAIYLWSSAAYSATAVLFALTSHFWLAVALLVAIGAFSSVSGNTAQILIQNACAGSMRARVMSLYSYNYRAMPALGALAMGTAANAIGFQIPVAVAAALCLAATLLAFRRRRAMRESLEAVNEDVPAAARSTGPKAAAE